MSCGAASPDAGEVKKPDGHVANSDGASDGGVCDGGASDGGVRNGGAVRSVRRATSNMRVRQGVKRARGVRALSSVQCSTRRGEAE